MDIEKELILKLSEFEDEILEVVDNQDEYTRSDLQGRVMAIVRNIYRAGQENPKLTGDITIEIMNGNVTDVYGLPVSWTYIVKEL